MFLLFFSSSLIYYNTGQAKHWKTPQSPGGPKVKGEDIDKILAEKTVSANMDAVMLTTKQPHKTMCKFWSKKSKEEKRYKKGKIAKCSKDDKEKNVDGCDPVIKDMSDNSGYDYDITAAHVAHVTREGREKSTTENINIAIMATTNSGKGLNASKLRMEMALLLSKCCFDPDVQDRVMGTKKNLPEPTIQTHGLFHQERTDRPELRTATTKKERKEHARLHHVYGGSAILPEDEQKTSEAIKAWLLKTSTGKKKNKKKETKKNGKNGVVHNIFEWSSLVVVDFQEPPSLMPGLSDVVMLHGLKTVKFNGKKGIRGVYCPFKKRVCIHLFDSKGRISFEGKKCWIRCENVFGIYRNEEEEQIAQHMRVDPEARNPADLMEMYHNGTLKRIDELKKSKEWLGRKYFGR